MQPLHVLINMRHDRLVHRWGARTVEHVTHKASFVSAGIPLCQRPLGRFLSKAGLGVNEHSVGQA
jgi:hypothetical protein